MDHCLMCGQAITTEDFLIAIETHKPVGQKGCSVEFRWVSRRTIPLLPQTWYAFGSTECAQLYFRRWMVRHMSKAA